MLIRLFLLVCTLAVSVTGLAQSGAPPTLVLTVVVDQFRADYLSRHHEEFEGGLRTLLDQGAVFTNANYEAMPTVTAVGHSTILTGAMPAVSGIAGNAWYEVSEGRTVESITDSDVTPLGGDSGASPRRLRVSTVGDELKYSGKGGKVYGVSLKDRGAILPAGHSADGAFWFDGTAGAFVSSTWYFPALPQWVQVFNAARPADQFAGREWMGVTMPEVGPQLNRALDSTPFADQMVLDFALALLAEEGLGRDDQTDLLSVSFSAMDYQGHANGSDTEAMHAMVLSVDDKIGQLIEAAGRAAGRNGLVVVFTADHGVAPLPEDSIARKLPAGRYDGRAEREAVQAALTKAFGEGDYILSASDSAIYLNRHPVDGKSIAYADLERVTAETMRAQPLVKRVYTRSDLERGIVGADRIDRRVRNGFNAVHSGDVIFIHEPYWLGFARGTTHGSPYSYDTHVPVIFMGPPRLVKRGHYNAEVAVQDIAPTLSTLLDIQIPSGSQGRVLTEMIP